MWGDQGGMLKSSVLCGGWVVGLTVTLAFPAIGFPVATSLNGMSGEPALLDLFKYSRHFGSADAPWDENCTVNPTTGWPTQSDFGVVIDWEPVPAARMLFSAVCASAPVFSITSGITADSPVWTPSTSTYTATLVTPASCDAGSGCNLFLTFLNTSRGCSAISVLQDGAKPTAPTAPLAFSAIYLAAVRNFAHLRMMDWGSTNSNPITTWDERTPIDWPSYRYGRTVPSRSMAKTPTSSATGAPYEVMIDLCNAALSDCWINVPALVDEDFITHLAQLVHQRLDPRLNVYLEFSNELWNDMFPQTGWHYNWSNYSVIHGDPLHLNYDHQPIGQWNCVPWSYRHTAFMAMRIGAIFGQVFGATEVPNGRVRPVLAGQMGDGPQWEGLQYLEAVHGDPSDYIHATANAPYFGMNGSAGRGSQNCQDGWSSDDVLNLLELELHKPGPLGGSGYLAGRDVKNSQAVSAVHALWYSVKVLTYEGGDDTSCFFANPSSVPAKKEANLDPRMADIAYTYLTGHAAHGQHYGALNWFVCCATSYDFIYGQWGISNNLYNFSEAPKWLGIERALQAPHPPPALGAPVPGVLNGSSDAVGRVLPSDMFCGAMEVFYVLNSPSGGTFHLALNGSSTGGSATLTFGLNNKVIGTVTVNSTLSPAPIPLTDTITLEAGVSALKVTMPDPPHECVRVHSIIVTP